MPNAQKYLGKTIRISLDCPLGSKHPKSGFSYSVNYGFVSGTISGDGEELDAYVLGVNTPLSEFSDDEIEEQTASFQEKWFQHIIIRQ